MSREESPHISSLRKHDKLNRLATRGFRVADGRVEKYETRRPVQDIERIVAAAEAAEIKAHEEAHAERIAAASPGQQIMAEGIYIGQYAPRDRDGNSLGKVFNVFAAPQDLTDDNSRAVRTYVDTVKHLSELKNWNGHDGADYEDDTEFYAALENGNYKGEWVILPRELVSGKDVDGKDVQPDHLLKHKNAGSLKDTFCLSAGGSDFPQWYWSSTENRDHLSNVWFADLSDGNENRLHKDSSRLSCRPVRLVPKP